MSVYYLNEKREPVGPVPFDDPLFHEYSKNPDSTVGRTEIGGYRVSTVFLLIDHRSIPGPASLPIVFETMIFPINSNRDNPFGDYQERYCTWKEAEAGHEKAIQHVTKKIAGKEDSWLKKLGKRVLL